MAIKIDLEKAYDRISWDYMTKVLEEVGCPEAMRQIIMKCVNSTSTKILWPRVGLSFCLRHGKAHTHDPRQGEREKMERN